MTDHPHHKNLTKEVGWKSKKFVALIIILSIYSFYLAYYVKAGDWQHNAVTASFLALVYSLYVFCQSAEDVAIILGSVKSLTHSESK